MPSPVLARTTRPADGNCSPWRPAWLLHREPGQPRIEPAELERHAKAFHPTSRLLFHTRAACLALARGWDRRRRTARRGSAAGPSGMTNDEHLRLMLDVPGDLVLLHQAALRFASWGRLSPHAPSALHGRVPATTIAPLLCASAPCFTENTHLRCRMTPSPRHSCRSGSVDSVCGLPPPALLPLTGHRGRMPSLRCSNASPMTRRGCELASVRSTPAWPPAPPLRACARAAFPYLTGTLRPRRVRRTLRRVTATCVAGSGLLSPLVMSARSRRTFLTSTLRPERCCFRKLDPTQAEPSQPSHVSCCRPTLPNTSECACCDNT